MNRRQRIIQERFIDNEEAVIGRLDNIYADGYRDISKRISVLDSDIGYLQKVYASVGDDDAGELARTFLRNKHITPAEAREKLQSRIQSKVYQKDFQTALGKEISGVLDIMHDREFKTISDYLQTCYEDGFIGTMYDLHGQGIPMAFPIDQQAVVRAVQLDSKINTDLYTRLGQDVDLLKERITAQVSRGVATGASWAQVARQLNGETNIGRSNAVRIARTEGHRIQCQAGMDACYEAREMGADVVKQWDATLDGKTRDSHAAVDGEWRELDEKFSNNLMFPGDPHGAAGEVINCRCALLERARWALDSGFSKRNNFTKELEYFDSPQAYEDFKKEFFSPENKQYMNYAQKMQDKYGTKDPAKLYDRMNDRERKHYNELFEKNPFYNKNARKATAAKPAKKTATKPAKKAKQQPKSPQSTPTNSSTT